MHVVRQAVRRNSLARGCIMAQVTRRWPGTSAILAAIFLFYFLFWYSVFGSPPDTRWVWMGMRSPFQQNPGRCSSRSVYQQQRWLKQCRLYRYYQTLRHRALSPQIKTPDQGLSIEGRWNIKAKGFNSLHSSICCNWNSFWCEKNYFHSENIQE